MLGRGSHAIRAPRSFAVAKRRVRLGLPHRERDGKDRRSRRKVGPRVRLQLLRHHRRRGQAACGGRRLHTASDRLRVQGGHGLRPLCTAHPGPARPGRLPPP
ncbi:hypothetical protein SGPA1_31198 [Streptomyces misionensis JCM 4497]